MQLHDAQTTWPGGIPIYLQLSLIETTENQQSRPLQQLRCLCPHCRHAQLSTTYNCNCRGVLQTGAAAAWKVQHRKCLLYLVRAGGLMGILLFLPFRQLESAPEGRRLRLLLCKGQSPAVPAFTACMRGMPDVPL